MTYFLIVFSVVAFVAGQLLLKASLNQLDALAPGDAKRRRVPWKIAASIFSMALSFFINVGLLQKLALSYLFPFQGLSVIMVAFSAAYFLKEKLTPALVIGVLLITAGVMVVSAS